MPLKSNVRPQMSITRATENVEAECEAVLRSLPLWFGHEASVLQYIRDTSQLPTFVSHEASRITGFITLRQHFEQSFEITCLAVLASRRGNGIGRELVQRASSWAAEQSGLFLQVKTLAQAHPSPEYAETRAFYASVGFTPLQVFPTLWSSANPCLQLVKALQRVA